MRYSIICDAQTGESFGIEKLALVDRDKSRDIWWTSDNPDLILSYRKKSSAEFACRRLNYNNPTVVSLKEAQEIIETQRKDIEYQECMNETEQGWESHKS